MMKKYKTILFDLDGTLLHTLPDLRTALNYAAKKMGLIGDNLEDNDDVQDIWHNWDE